MIGRIRMGMPWMPDGKMMRIQPDLDPDSQHWNMMYNIYKAKIFGTLFANGRLQFRSVFYTVNLCLVTIKYKNPSWTNITVPQKNVFDFKE